VGLQNKVVACLATCALLGCAEQISRNNSKEPIQLENGLPMLDTCLSANHQKFKTNQTFEADASEMGMVARSLGAVGPSCHVYFATKASRADVMSAINERGEFVKFVEVPGGRLAMYKQREGSRYFLMTPPLDHDKGGEFFEALVVGHDPT